LYCIFSCIYVITICFFKASSLDGHMAFLVAVTSCDYVIFLLVLILYASLENKFFFFYYLNWRNTVKLHIEPVA